MLVGLALVTYTVGARLGLLPRGYTTVPDPVALRGAGSPDRRREDGLGLIGRAFGSTLPSRLGTALMLVGLALVTYTVSAYLGLLPGGYTTVPEPVALSGGQRAARLEAPLSAPTTVPVPTALPAAVPQAGAPELAASQAAPAAVAPPAPAATAAPRPRGETVAAPPVALKLDPADADDRRLAALAPRPGIPVRLQLPSINVDTEVKEGGIVEGPEGQLEWETLPFVAVAYPVLGPVGAPGNPVITGHVVTLREGNVFRDLYRVQLGELIEVYTDHSHFTYQVEEIQLVPPTAVDVMEPTEDARLTVITCGGTFDPRTRTFSHRLIVVGELVGAERL